MRKHLLAGLMAIAIVAPVSAPTAAMAQRWDQPNRNQHSQNQRNQRDYRWQGDQRRDWEPSQHYQARSRGERRLSRNDYIYKGKDGRAYCKRNDGTTGLVVGAVGGGVLANLVGGNTLETLLGAGGGALLGRSLDRGQVRCR
jgi:hypothetical protein